MRIEKQNEIKSKISEQNTQLFQSAFQLSQYYKLMLYRTDIDGLRAFAVISVVLFHLGFLPNGYLGVDIFFVISGYLITSIIYSKSEKNQFSILDFYQRRIRRIIPLLLFTTTLALIIGLFLMLPDDLDNLAQSVFASNFSANNILMYITSSDYWSVKNEYKPLMHTWSLGIEEQYYLIYPFIFLFLQGGKVKYIKISLFLLTIISLSFFLISDNSAQKFYLLHHRFFEFTIGGLGAILFKNTNFKSGSLNNYMLIFSAIAGLITIAYPSSDFNSIKIIVITLSTSIILIVGKNFSNTKTWYDFIFENKLAVTIGKISFSIYMMHQLIFAFSRYAFLEEITSFWAFNLVALTIAVSFLTYHFIENPLRNHKAFSFKKVLLILIPVFLVGSIASLYIYSIGGIIKDYPELSVYKEDYKFERKLFRITTNIHIQYNEDVRQMDRDFEETDKVKILVFGNSFGRDITNILLEYDIQENFQISYFDIARTYRDEGLKNRIEEADIIFIAAFEFMGKEWISNIEYRYQFKIDQNKIWTFGIKDFGTHNGIHYHSISEDTDFVNYRTKIKAGVIELNEMLKSEWETRYIDLISPVIDTKGEVLVFTPEGKFLSPDTVHLTEEGAKYYAKILQYKLSEIMPK